jgi:hypothetical protein
MKRFVSLAMLCLFGLAITGCHASVDTNPPDNGDSHYKKTTTYNDNGTKTTHTESTETNP